MLTPCRSMLLAAVLHASFLSLAHSQESVPVPQMLQRDVQAFNLAMDSLRTLTEGIQSQTAAVSRELKIMQQKMDLLPPGSRTHLLERRRYEEKYSNFLTQNYATLQRMQELRLQTLAHLEKILDRLQQNDTKRVQATRDKIREQMRQYDERLAQTRLEMLELLTRLKSTRPEEEEAQRLNHRIQRLHQDRLALYASNQRRLGELLALTGEENTELPEVQRSLRTMWENLHTGFDWIETEMAYIRLFAEYRKNRLDMDAQLVEVSGLAERFREAVMQINANSRLLREMQDLERYLYRSRNGRPLLPEIPALQWPGQPENAGSRLLSQQELDSLQQELERDLQPVRRAGSQ